MGALDEVTREAQLRPFPIVGVGASAGGLDAFTQLLECLPDDTGMAFVLVQHLDPLHTSELARLLARATRMPTHEIADGARVLPNHVYVIPPNANLTVDDGVLKLHQRREGRAPHRSVDVFFEALAHDQRERAIGIILSGTATDGTRGLEAIKNEGGITFAQDESAKQHSMPRSAIAAGCADFVLSPRDIAAELVRIAAHPHVTALTSDVAAPATTAEPDDRSGGERERESAVQHQDDDSALPSGGHGVPHSGARNARNESAHGAADAKADDFRDVLAILRAHCGVDFSLYKSSTIQRRVTRRMALSRHTRTKDYAAFLKGNTRELDTLFSDVLISVTSFFRNPDAFHALKQTVFPQLLERDGGTEGVRVWVLGCSTGQEAYSIAMAFAEFADTLARVPKLQIFATDLNEALLDKAREGLYAKTVAADLSPDRLRRFFSEEQGGYRVAKSLREQIVFARQNLISDPPFSRIDLISCRNLLIYLEPGLQKKIIPSFHYALRTDGFLFLGASESVGEFTDLFEPADKKLKIFRKRPAPMPRFHIPSAAARSYPPRGAASVHKLRQGDGARDEWQPQREADRYALAQFVPPGVLIDAEFQILQFRGVTGAYLEPPTGRATFDVLKMAKRRLVLPLRAALESAAKTGEIVRAENIRLDDSGGDTAVTIRVVPLRNLKERCFLILFEQAAPRRFAAAPAAGKPVDTAEEAGRIAALERELAELRDFQQSVQETSDAAAEELQASNEEAQSTNEELQSINEELETSKEELESTNEELTTVNEEMASRNLELQRLNADLTNLQSNIPTAVVLLARDLTIRRFTEPAQKLFELLPTDIGRPLGAIRHHLTGARFVAAPGEGAESAGRVAFPLEAVIADVIESVAPRDGEVRDHGGRWYALRIRPYLTLDKKVDGAVLTLTDVDALKQSEQEAKRALEYVRAIQRTTRSPLVVLERDYTVRTVNAAFCETFRIERAEAEGASLFDIGRGAWRIPELPQLLNDVFSGDASLHGYEVSHAFPSLGRRDMLLDGRRLEAAGERAEPLILLSIDDITERKRIEDKLRDADHRKDEFLATLAHELRNPLAPLLNVAHILRRSPVNGAMVGSASDVILRQVDHMVRLIDDLLDASRVTRGQIALQRARVDLAVIVQQVVDAARAAEKNRVITLSLPPEPVFVDADPVRLAQVAGNLLNNARKFTSPNGHIVVSLVCSAHQACLRVRDDGIGMAADQIGRIFDMFTQLDTSLQRATGGLGIGLALVKRLVEMHDGTVVASSPGTDRGSEFVVHLPLLDEAKAASAALAEAPVEPVVSGLRILIVDDNRDTADSLAALLELTDNTTHIATNGMDAIGCAESFRPDVIMLDIGMPELNGYQVARRIREQPWGKSIVLIALTGWGQDEDRQKSREAGFDGHLVKPAEFRAIAALVHKARADGGS